MIRHLVVFKLKHPKDSREEKLFISAAEKLSFLPGVNNFECSRQVSNKNDFDFVLSMEFSNKLQYEEYTSHADHLQFVADVWIKEVETYLEIDYEPM